MSHSPEADGVVSSIQIVFRYVKILTKNKVHIKLFDWKEKSKPFYQSADNSYLHYSGVLDTIQATETRRTIFAVCYQQRKAVNKMSC